ncbi:MarR family transcriptional regulator [Opitutales bacterium]|nr:MarR family transcriptional regulator [Opitutales bacterium]
MKSDKFPILLRYCWFGLNQEFRKKIQPIALTTVQYTVLRTIHEKLPDSINQSDLSKLISTNKNNISSIVKRLLVLGYVKTSVNLLDKREKQISISETGIAIYLTAKKQADGVKQALFQNFKQSELSTLNRYFKRINKKADSLK